MLWWLGFGIYVGVPLYYVIHFDVAVGVEVW